MPLLVVLLLLLRIRLLLLLLLHFIACGDIDLHGMSWCSSRCPSCCTPDGTPPFLMLSPTFLANGPLLT